MKALRISKRANFLSIISTFILLAPTLTFAISYTPGQTLDPSCSPSDPTCVIVRVATNIAGSFTATSTTATSTFAGFFGIGTTTPNANFEVAGKSISLNSSQDGTLGNWVANANSLPAVRAYGQSVTANGYVYYIGGSSANPSWQNPQSNIYYAKVNGDGSIGSWTTNALSLPIANEWFEAVVANGYLYTIGGFDSVPSHRAIVTYARLNADGSVGTSTVTTPLPTGMAESSAFVANGYVYVVGGENQSGHNVSTIFYAKLNADGSIGAWTTNSNNLPDSNGNAFSSTVVANGYAYVIGGVDEPTSFNHVPVSTVYYAKLRTDGSIGVWSTTSALPTTLGQHSAAAANGYVYVFGGTTDSANTVSTSYYAKFNPDGTIGAWSSLNNLPQSAVGFTSVTVNGYMYIIGGLSGNTATGTFLSNIYYTSTARLKFSGDLDLLGLTAGSSGIGDTSGDVGGSIFAGNIFSSNKLEIMGNAQLWNGLSVNGPVTILGSSTSSTNSLLFNISTTTNNSIFNVSSSGNVGIGTTTPWARLSVTGASTGANSGLAFAAADSNNSPIFVVQNSGAVGIGTTTPVQLVNSNTRLYIADSFANTGTERQGIIINNQYGRTDGLTSGSFFEGVKVMIGTPATHNGNFNFTGASFRAFDGQIVVPSGSTGSISGAAVFYARDGSVSGTAPTNQYGLYLESLTAGTNNYGVFFAGNPNGGSIASAANTNITIKPGTNGNVGIGTTTPWGLLSVSTPANSSVPQFVVASTTAVSFIVDQSGLVGIGTTSPSRQLTVSANTNGAGGINVINTNTGNNSTASLAVNEGTGGSGFMNLDYINLTFATSSTFFTANSAYLRASAPGGMVIASQDVTAPLTFQTGGVSSIGGSKERMRVTAAGSVGIGTSTPTAQLSTTGTVRFSNFGAGTLTTDASGNLSVSSDERLKNIDGSFTRGLSDIMKLSPISYHWNTLSGLDMTTGYSGFSAQNVQTAIPEAVGSSTNGFLTLQDRPILAATVNAIKDIGSITGIFKDNLIAWLGNTSNGITSIFAQNGNFNTTNTQTICVDGECLTKSDVHTLLQMVQAQNGIGGSSGPTNVSPDENSTDSTSTPQTTTDDTSTTTESTATVE